MQMTTLLMHGEYDCLIADYDHYRTRRLDTDGQDTADPYPEKFNALKELAWL